MVESFKITAQILKRILKISVNLPKDYNSNEMSYPVIIALDGQLLYNFINEDTKKINMAECLDSFSKDCICIALQSPKIPEWRISELNPYYSGKSETVDSVLSYIYYEYIVNELIPLLKERYRFNDEIYLLGFKEGAIAALYMVYRYNIFKGAGIFNPTLEECNIKLSEDINKNFSSKKKMYLFQGGLGTDSKIDSQFYNLYTRLESLKCEMIEFDFDSNSDNSYKAYENHITNFLEFMLP